MAKKKVNKAKPKKKAAPKKAASKKKHPPKSGGHIAKAPIRRLMKAEGAELVAEDAVTMLIKQLEKVGTKVTKDALKIVKAEKRKRITAADILAAQ
ncbi:histone [Candidatus Harpocratesius sp.]